MAVAQQLIEEILDLEIHFTERVDDGADSNELTSILNKIRSLKAKTNTRNNILLQQQKINTLTVTS